MPNILMFEQPTRVSFPQAILPHMKKLLMTAAFFVLLGQGCSNVRPTPQMDRPVPAPLPPAGEIQVDTSATIEIKTGPESSEQNMPPQDNTTPPPASGSSTYNVRIEGFAFIAPSIKVKKGDKIIFQNLDKVGHTATADNGKFDSGSIKFGESWTLDTSSLAAGTYPYFCIPHPNMRATIIVE